jgi:GNAT superfamily N-acetyltransferase
MKWIIRDVKKCSARLRKIFVAATPLGEDYMREAVILSKKRKENSYIAVALFNEKELIGWAMLDYFLSKGSKNIRTYIYVKTKFRRKGYGTKILNKARDVSKENNCNGIKVCPHTKSSLRFFKKANIKKEEVVRGYKY